MLLKSYVLGSPAPLYFLACSMTLARPCCSLGLGFPICAMGNGLEGPKTLPASLPMSRWALLPTHPSLPWEVYALKRQDGASGPLLLGELLAGSESVSPSFLTSLRLGG